MSGIISYCHIKDSLVYKNGNKVFEHTPDSVNDFSTALYSWLGIDYPKIHKMDSLCKMGFLASEIISQDIEKEYSTSTSVVLSNTSSSLDTDLQYWKSMKVLPSPSLFVYTLPNIVAGEICIRNGFKGESIFFVTPSFDVARISTYVEMLFSGNEAERCLAGWVEVFNGRVDVFLYLAGKSVNEPFALHTASAIRIYIYMENLIHDLKKQVISVLNLKHLKPEDIEDDQPLFQDGLGLDSIDALELIVLLQQQYQIKLTNPQEGPAIFKSIKSMAEFIQVNKKPDAL